MRTSRTTATVLSLALGAPIAVPKWDTQAQDPSAASPCQELPKEIRAVYLGLPETFRGLSTERIEAVARDVDQGLQKAERYLIRCQDGEHAGEVDFFLAKFLHVLSRRYQSDTLAALKALPAETRSERFLKAMEEYHERIAFHAGRARKKLDPASELLPLAIELEGRGHQEAKNHTEARDCYTAFLAKHPEHPSAAAVTTALGRVYLDLSDFDRGIELLDRAEKNLKIYSSPSFPYLGEVRWKLVEAKGDLEAMLQCARDVLTRYPLRLGSSVLDSNTREAYERYLDFAGFRQGYALLALGRFQEAEEAFGAHIQALDRKENELREKGAGLKPESTIYRNRSQDTLDFLREKVGRPAPADFDLKSHWVTSRRLTLAEARGKVLVVVFRAVNDQRSAPFCEKIDDFVALEPAADLVIVSYLRASAPAEEQAENLRDELARLDVEHPAGFDPDMERKSIFRAYGANVGSATCVILDKDSRPVWFEQDPRGVDANLVISILRRRLGK